MKNFQLCFLIVLVWVLTACNQLPAKEPAGATAKEPAERTGETDAVLDAIGKDISKADASLIRGGGLSKREYGSALTSANYAQVQVFYATDRKATGGYTANYYGRSDLSYGSERSDLSYGKCMVSIPRGHRIGELEDSSIFMLEFREDPEKHVVLLSIEQQDKDSYFKVIANKIAQSKRKSAFIFIHGFSVTFEDAARQTAQISYDLKFDGVPVFYSWPTRGNVNLMDYYDDGTNIEWTQAHLESFLNDFASKASAEYIYVIAHSMGTRALTKALISVVRNHPEYKDRFKEVILAAPDIDAETFKNQIAPALVASSKAVTLYASSKDWALYTSGKFNGYQRAGDSSPSLMLVEGIETVDATNVDTSLIGHSYVAENKSVLSDIIYLISGKRPDQRYGLTAVNAGSKRYWTFKK